MQLAPFRGGQPPAPGSRPNATDYTDEVKELLLDAVKIFYCLIYTVDMWPSVTKQRELVCRAWKAACDAQEDPVVWWLSDRMIRVIGARKSNARGDTFNLAEGTRSPDLAEHKFVTKAAQVAFFANVNTSVGYNFPQYFDPMPEQAIAFLLTVIRAHIGEWESGRFVKQEFDETRNKSHYVGFLKDLKKYGAKNTTAWLNIRKRLFKRAFLQGGGIPVRTDITQASTATMEAAATRLEARSGLTESEDEGEDDASGCE
ncbi:hypothetical protein C8Q80DRAFT_1090253 [Daedaleopsis nitida]|nr:hypothetical protein C8Q80DRAFT_1090253 [Daedaleopsis nitida]